MTKAVLLGATKGMGRSLARLMAARGDGLCLLGRDAGALERSATDLSVLAGGAAVATAVCDLEQPNGFGAALDAADAALGGFDTVVLSAGVFAQPDDLDDDPAAAARLLTVNFTNSVLFLEEARRRLLAKGGGTLCAFSSVAGDRARKPTGLYGATKAGLSHYMEALDLRHRPAGLRAVLVKPGFVHTGMTAALPAPPFAGQPDDVAQRVLKAIDGGWPVVYAPVAWWGVMRTIGLLPRAVMRRVDF